MESMKSTKSTESIEFFQNLGYEVLSLSTGYRMIIFDGCFEKRFYDKYMKYMYGRKRFINRNGSVLSPQGREIKSLFDKDTIPFVGCVMFDGKNISRVFVTSKRSVSETTLDVDDDFRHILRLFRFEKRSIHDMFMGFISDIRIYNSPMLELMVSYENFLIPAMHELEHLKDPTILTLVKQYLIPSMYEIENLKDLRIPSLIQQCLLGTLV